MNVLNHVKNCFINAKKDEEKGKKKRKPIFKLKKEKSVMYYSGWHRGKPLETKEEKQIKLK